MRTRFYLRAKSGPFLAEQYNVMWRHYDTHWVHKQKDESYLDWIFIFCLFVFQTAQLLRTPFIKFLAQSASFLVFLALIVTFSFTEKPTSGTIKVRAYIKLSL